MIKQEEKKKQKRGSKSKRKRNIENRDDSHAHINML